jgi:hypothetical protein
MGIEYTAPNPMGPAMTERVVLNDPKLNGTYLSRSGIDARG